MSDIVRLPAEFSNLQAFADRFAISDDVDRDAATTNASDEDKQLFVDAVSPHFEEINAYLDRHDDESAHLLGSLAEAACEVAIEIDRQKRA